MKPKIVAYITRRDIHPVDAVRPETVIGSASTPVSEHPDYRPWTRSREHTLALAAGVPSYLMYSARSVCDALGWWAGKPLERIPPKPIPPTRGPRVRTPVT